MHSILTQFLFLSLSLSLSHTLSLDCISNSYFMRKFVKTTQMLQKKKIPFSGHGKYKHNYIEKYTERERERE